MSERYDHGPLRTYEVTWTSGHVETVQAHQVLMPPDEFGLFSVATRTDRVRNVRFHGEIDGHWQLVLCAREDEIRSIRDVTQPEVIPGAEADR